MLEAKPPSKSPDLLVSRDGIEFYVECKRQSRRPTYSDREHQAFLRMWEGIPTLVREVSGQWIWIDMAFHQEITRLPESFLTEVLASALPLGQGEQTILDDEHATIRVRLIDRKAVARHMKSNRVKHNSSMLRSLLGGDWAPRNSNGPMALLARYSTVAGCEALPSGRFVDDIAWAMGGTRVCDAPQAVAAKARDVKRLLVDAVRQLPQDKTSIVHIAVETHEGRAADRLRDQRIRDLLGAFKVDRPVAAVFVHSIQYNEVIDTSWEVDETVQWWYGPMGEIANVPQWLVVPPHTAGIHRAHWEIYP
ncbi:hypothetical protein [Variovorax sp. WS11]|uniref:hypothetical protein n=1 Tax=Variovorax sp. WS11 TaxID=1105204 RepID=UPI0011B1F4E1|nr:hypothetical protein [Variovorax sp. WS11]NDZ15546.1 hypothetical protein [Variovorax sp. WS11]